MRYPVIVEVTANALDTGALNRLFTGSAAKTPAQSTESARGRLVGGSAKGAAAVTGTKGFSSVPLLENFFATRPAKIPVRLINERRRAKWRDEKSEDERKLDYE